ncbi:MAG: oligosaccharide flippase family protein [Gammaproteobacteria bacterium]|nr:oligosaccharide flippase family protein [Gammaproteobacteria bacterium]
MDHQANMHRGFNWLGSATVVTKLLDFGTTLTVLWFLTKQEVGTAALILSISVVIEAVSGLGVDAALVQAKWLSRRQLDSTFWFALGVNGSAATLVALAAPLIERLYGIAGMAIYFVVVAAKLPLVGIALVPLALMTRELKYERIAIVNVAATFAAAVTRLIVAMLGGGVWAFVAGYAADGLFILIGAQIAQPFLPRLCFQARAIRSLVRFGIRAAASTGLQQLYKNVDVLLVGWFYGPSPLAIYRVAITVAMGPAIAIGAVVSRAVFPVFSKIAAAGEHLAPAFIWAIGRIAILIGPLMVALVLAASPLTALVHDARGSSYAAAALPLQLLAVAALLRSMFELLYPLTLATGRPQITMRVAMATLALLTAGITTAGSVFGAQAGIVAVAGVWLILYPLLLAWGTRYVSRTLAIGLRELARSLALPLLAGAGVVAVALSSRLFIYGAEPRLQVAGIVVALALTYAGAFAYTRRRALASG